MKPTAEVDKAITFPTHIRKQDVFDITFQNPPAFIGSNKQPVATDVWCVCKINPNVKNMKADGKTYEMDVSYFYQKLCNYCKTCL